MNHITFFVFPALLTLASISTRASAFAPSPTNKSHRGCPSLHMHMALGYAVLGRFLENKKEGKAAEPIRIGTAMPEVDMQILSRDEDEDATSPSAFIQEVFDGEAAGRPERDNGMHDCAFASAEKTIEISTPPAPEEVAEDGQAAMNLLFGTALAHILVGSLKGEDDGPLTRYLRMGFGMQ